MTFVTLPLPAMKKPAAGQGIIFPEVPNETGTPDDTKTGRRAGLAFIILASSSVCLFAFSFAAALRQRIVPALDAHVQFVDQRGEFRSWGKVVECRDAL